MKTFDSGAVSIVDKNSSSGTIESRWMDEHIVLNANTVSTQSRRVN
jgi:hypothetical protein